MNSILRSITLSVFLVLAYVPLANAGILLVNLQNESSPGNALDTIVLLEQMGNDVKFTLTVDSSVTGNIGDLRAFYFDVADVSLLGGLSVTGVDVTDRQFLANKVKDLGNGSGINPLGPFDAGVEIGTQGMSGDDIQTTSFVISHLTATLDANSFLRSATTSQDLIAAVRATSVGAVGSSRNGSSKTGGSTFSQVPEPTSALVWMGGLALFGLVRRSKS